MTGSPFRKAALRGRDRRLSGELRVHVAPGFAVMSCLLLLAFGLLAAFAAIAGYAGKHHAVGLLVPVGGVVPVHAEGRGHIARVHVEDGAAVVAGQSLVTVAGTRRGADGTATDAARAARLADEIRVVASRREALARELEIEHAALAAEVASREAERTLLADELRIAEELAVIADRAYASAAALAARGLLASRDLDAARGERLAARHRQVAAERNLKRVAGEATVLRHSIRQRTEAARRDDLLLEQQRSALERHWLDVSALGETLVVAPVAGRVTALQAVAGAPVSARPLLVLLPDASEVEAHLYIDSSAIGSVRPGQPVRLALDAWDYRRHGWQHGRVATVSGTALVPADAGVPWLGGEPLYRLTVTLDRQYVEVDGAQRALHPGNRVSAHVLLDRRSLLAWLVDPLLRWRDRA